MRPVIFSLSFWTLAFGFSAHPVYAEFILDDFDDSAEVVSPEMENVPFVSSDVGTLNATRTIEIAGAGVDPTARLDTNISSLSAMWAELTELNRTDQLTPLLAFQFNYEFTPTDVSQGGVNDAIFFDFRSISGTESPTFLRVITRDNTFLTLSFESRIYDPPINTGTFTAVMPFSSFTLRGGTPGLPDFTTFKRMDFDFFFLGPSNDIQWSAELERIRFGRIPEPLSSTLFLVGVVCLAGCRRRYLR